MTCPRCGTTNSVYETRCTRCGAAFAATGSRSAARALPERSSVQEAHGSTGLLPPGGARPFLVNPQARYSALVSNAVVVPPVTQAGADHPGSYISTGSTARQLDVQPASQHHLEQHHLEQHHLEQHHGHNEAPAHPVPARPELRIAPPSPQPSLFQPGEIPSQPTALRLRPVPATPDAGTLPRRRPERRRAKSDMLPFAQGTLDFLTPSAPQTRQLRTKVDATILCDHHGAAPVHRIAAMMVDGAYTLIAAAFVCLVSYLAFRYAELPLPAKPSVLYWGLAGVWAGVILAYQLLFTFLDRETLGYQALGLRVMNLDGSIPGRTERWKRLLAMGASLLPCGVGFIWAFCDEEHLSWHDHISGTFPAPRSSVESSFRRA